MREGEGRMGAVSRLPGAVRSQGGGRDRASTCVCQGLIELLTQKHRADYP